LQGSLENKHLKINKMNISIWISITALAVSIGAFIHTVLTNQSKVRISLSAKRNSLRIDVHEASMKLLGLIDKMIKGPQSDQYVRILKKMVETTKGLVSIYKVLDENLTVPWRMQTMIAIEYDYLSTKLHEFTRVFDIAQISFDAGDLDNLESIIEGMYNRILGGTKESENHLSKPAGE
jgi:hypothetical protein